MPKSRNRKKSRSGKNRTSLQNHKKVGKQLQSGFAVVADKVTFSSWSNERLPEMIWAAIIRVIDDQDYAIAEFRRILSFIGEHGEKDRFSDISLTGISKLPEGLKEQFIGFILENKTTASALVVRFINMFTKNAFFAMIASNYIRRLSWHGKQRELHWCSRMTARNYLSNFQAQ